MSALVESDSSSDSSSAIKVPQTLPTASVSSDISAAPDKGTEERLNSNSPQPLSKNKQRKQRTYVKLLLQRPIKRQRERELRKQKGLRKSLGKNEKLALVEKLKSAFNNAPKVVIDCQFDDQMTNKQRSRLAQQLRRAYSSNKACDQPVHLIFASLSESSEFFELCCKLNDGFSNYVVDRKEENVKELFPNDEIVYLSPDSANVLTEFDSEKVYVIGGVVDESTKKNISLEFSNSNQIRTARLPIDEYFVAEKGSGTFKKVLCVNQVFDIILAWYQTQDWVKAISAGLPERTGFVPRLQ